MLIGDWLEDVWIRVTFSGRVSDGVPVATFVSESQTLGGAGNVSRCINSLGGLADRHSPIGEWPTKRRLVDHLTGKVLFRWDESDHTDRPYDPQSLQRFYDSVKSTISGVIVSDYNKGSITGELAFLHQAAKDGKKIYIDTKQNPSIYNNPAGAIYFPNMDEHYMFKSSYDKLEKVFITMAHNGAALVEKGKTICSYPQRWATELKSHCGAGDVVVAAYAMAENDPEFLQFEVAPGEVAMIAAAHAIKREDTIYAMRSEVLNTLKEEYSI
jgi:bifunctional ADP-heptose synthase (sugar kinase/adenylyltransferase)